LLQWNVQLPGCWDILVEDSWLARRISC